MRIRVWEKETVLWGDESEDIIPPSVGDFWITKKGITYQVIYREYEPYFDEIYLNIFVEYSCGNDGSV